MKKIFLVHTGVFETNGISEMITNLVQRLMRESDCEIIIGYNGKKINNKYVDFFSDLNIEMVNLGNKRKNLFIYLRNIRNISKKVDIVHLNGNSGMMGLEMLFLHKKNKILISHVHNTLSEFPFFEKYFKKIIKKKSHFQLAASKAAGLYLYGESDFIVVPNGIDTKKFSFREDKENIQKLKQNYGLPLNKKIYLNVGRIEHQKNQIRLVTIFKEMVSKQTNIHLLIVGNGKDLKILKEKIRYFHLEDNITILKEEKEMEKIYLISNFFILPSRFEAFPVTLIEAQASGLTCMVSQESVGEEVNIDGNVKFLSLSKSDSEWSREILNLKENVNRSQNYMLVYKRGYDKENSFDKLIDIYKKNM